MRIDELSRRKPAAERTYSTKSNISLSKLGITISALSNTPDLVLSGSHERIRGGVAGFRRTLIYDVFFESLSILVAWV